MEKGPQKQPIHSSFKAILDSPAWRLVDALRSMYDPQTNRILIDGFYDAIRPPNAEEEAMLSELIRRSGSQLLAQPKKNANSWINGWSDAEAVRHLMFDTTMNINGMWSGYTGPGAATIVPEKAAVKIDFRLVPNQNVATQRSLVEAHSENTVSPIWITARWAAATTGRKTACTSRWHNPACDLPHEPCGRDGVAAFAGLNPGSAIHSQARVARDAGRSGPWR